jgi:hypothetical protein
LAISDKKINSAEDGIDGTIGLFRRNSGCSAEQKTLGIPFRTIPEMRKMFGILHCGTKIEENFSNFVLNHSAQRKRKQLGIPFRGTKIEANTWNSDQNHSAEEKTTRNSFPWNKNRSKLSEFRAEACLGRKNAIIFVCWSRNFSKANFCHAIFFCSELRN